METGASSEICSLSNFDEDKRRQKNVETQSVTSRKQRSTCLSETARKTIIGIIIVIFLAVSWVGAQQFAQSAVRLHSFDAPYFATWFSTCWMLVCYPGYLLFVTISGIFSSEHVKDALRGNIRISTLLFGAKLFTTRNFFIIWILNIIWLAVNYLYIFGLKFIFATDASAIMASNVAFVYILSLFVLHEKLYAIRIVASVLCIGGVVLFGYAEGFQGGSNTLAGVLLIVGSAVGAAVYKVFFKRVVGDATLGQVSLFLTLLGVCNVLLMWPVSIVLYFGGVESFAGSDIPWQPLILSAILGLNFNFLVNFGIAYTYPLFISVAMMIGIPLNAGVDVIIHHSTFSALRLVAAVLVFTGFAIMLFPDSWNDPIHSLVGCNNRDSKRKALDNMGSGKTVTESLLVGDSLEGLPLQIMKTTPDTFDS